VDDENCKVTTVTPGLTGANDEVNGGLLGSSVIEGDAREPLIYTVTLNGTTTENTTVTMKLSGNSNSGSQFSDIDGQNIIVHYMINDVEQDPITIPVAAFDTEFNVILPPGVNAFVVKVPTNQDADVEPDGKIVLTAGTAFNVDDDIANRTATGTIEDDDSADIVLTPSGLFGEYFGYNDSANNVQDGYRLHSDDFTKQNLDSIQDVEDIIAGRSSADVTFNARNINYGGYTYNAADNNSPDLGDNTSQSHDGDVNDTNQPLNATPDNHLYNFISANNTDQITNATDANILAGDPYQGTSGLGKTTDAIIRLSGGIIVDRGIYDIRVTADDGFRLKIGGQTLAEYDGNQFIIERTFNNISLDKGGLQPIEILYWEQGGQAQLKIEVKLSSAGPDDWQTLGVDSGFALFSAQDLANLDVPKDADGMPIISDDQEFYQDTDGTYKVREIGTITGSGQIVGTENTDKIEGSSGVDTINAGDGDDQLSGNNGDDTLIGDAGNDRLNGGAGNDTMVGGLGDDQYFVDSAGDIVTEAANQGTDTIIYEVDIGVEDISLAENIENVTLDHDGNVNLIGNAANNILKGRAGDNEINGGAGNDKIYGGAGDDTLTGGSGNDVFVWGLNDKGAIGVPDEDHITDFVYTGNGQGNIKDIEAARPTDSIDLRDLLEGEFSEQLDVGANPDIGNLLEYLNFSVEGGSTVINISTKGNFAGDGTMDTSQVDQRIVLDGVDLYANTGASSQTELLQRILVNGTLIVD
jgi:Ca2+-binding RTX toxin-like protein